MSEKLMDIYIYSSSILRDAITAINHNERGIALVVDGEQRLLGTITDGDIRRAILDGKGLTTPVVELLAQRAASPYPEAITAREGTDPSELLRLMKDGFVKQLPILNDRDQVVDLVTMEDLLPDDALPIQAVIMAGGYGTRLSPLTKDVPKPMLPVGDRPLMEHTVEQLKRVGIKNVSITTHYLTEQISKYFGDGSEFGIEIKYIKEEHPLGTAGALGLMEAPDEPLLVINGDILTRVDFRAMLDFHRKHGADLTVGVRQYEMEVPYGVLDCEGPNVVRLSEKPRHSFLVNAGVYLLDSSVHGYVPHQEHFNMTDLIDRLLEENRKVVSFPILEYWLDIGHPRDYEQAQEDVENGRV
jgi:dTDP-glucose pyrophosphorylase/CBS domain-containing protein